MKTISRTMMTAVLLVAVLTASAQGVTKGSSNPIVGTGEIFYSFSGGKVIEKSAFKEQLSYSYEVEEGATLSFSCFCSEKVGWPRIVISDGNGKTIKETKGKSASMTYQVPKGQDGVCVTLDIYNGVSTHPTEVVISCKVKKPSKKLSSYKGTISYLDTKMEYSFSGAIVTQKKVTDQGYSTNAMQIEIKGQTVAGSTVSATYKKIAGCVEEKLGATASITAYTSGGNTINLLNKSEKSGNGSSTYSGKVPDNAKTIHIFFSYQNINYRQINCSVTLDVVKKANAQENKSLKWNDESTANRCEHCNGQISNYTVNSTSFNAYVCCNNHRKEQKKYARKVNSWYDYIYYNDIVWTDDSGPIEVFNKCDDVKITLMENSTIFLKKRTNDGRDIWVLEKGTIVGEGLKRTDCEFEMTYCTAKPTGTTYVLENDGKSSRVYLLEGSMEVTSKKGYKKSKLKPGQAVAVTNQGQMSVNSFDVGAMAKKYKISGVSTTTTKEKNARYDMKCAVVKYKYTKGKEKGQHERAFDNYGKVERRYFKISNKETLLYIRDNKDYTLDVQKKTMTVSDDVQLNFLYPDKTRIKKITQKKPVSILGKTCTLYQSSTSDYYVWKGVVLKKVERLKNGTKAIYEATSIQMPSSLPASTFEIPKGYKTK